MKNYLKHFEKIFNDTNRYYEKHSLKDRTELHLLDGYTHIFINFVFNKQGGLLGISAEEGDPYSNFEDECPTII